jgi:hypothetical protein
VAPDVEADAPALALEYAAWQFVGRTAVPVPARPAPVVRPPPPTAGRSGAEGARSGSEVAPKQAEGGEVDWSAVQAWIAARRRGEVAAASLKEGDPPHPYEQAAARWLIAQGTPLTEIYALIWDGEKGDRNQKAARRLRPWLATWMQATLGTGVAGPAEEQAADV